MTRRSRALDGVKSDNDADRERLAQAEAQRSTFCPARPVREGGANVLSEYTSPGPRTFRQYLDVGCTATNQGELRIPLSEDERKTLKITSVAKPHFEGVANLNWYEADAKPDSDGDEILVSYRMRGLDRQLLGSCPGGGHGTLVVEYKLVPRSSGNT
jgi:hypothetical protein